MQRMSHYYAVIVCRAYCMDAEYAIYTLLVKSGKIVEKIAPQGKYLYFDVPNFFKSRFRFANNDRDHTTINDRPT